MAFAFLKSFKWSMNNLFLNSKMEIVITCRRSPNPTALTNAPRPSPESSRPAELRQREGGRTGAVTKDGQETHTSPAEISLKTKSNYRLSLSRRLLKTINEHHLLLKRKLHVYITETERRNPAVPFSQSHFRT